ncbi:chromosomal replication initiator protein DnaA [Mycoplasma yeatsii]|uniref:Chromosomal replication initiator protein DnaA n=1 Tax=Mycoplasma yeatsii TaxID=51365 RepID=A0ABU0NFG7_9MOLU|nr:chromosomal replication initiator protein DnaA [Mycoplasma yeatsii]MDQ0567689.1 chromosomal replication initiator protein [Mycoplasma yeatsii]
MEEKDLLKKLKLSLSENPNIDEAVYNEYISTSKLYKKSENEYVFVVKSIFGLKTIKHIEGVIQDVIKKELHNEVLLSFTDEKKYKKEQEALSSQATKQEEQVKPKSSSLLKKPSRLIGNTFDNFVVGPSNEQAFLAAQTVAKNPGFAYNPLFIYGESGMGKTHILKATKNYIENNFSDLKVVYMSGEEFARKAIDVLQKTHQEIEAFKDDILINDVLIIDDIQFLSNKIKTNELLFTIFNNFIEYDKQLIFSSDKSPEQLNGFDNRLITRFNMGLSIPIMNLDIKTATAIIKKELKEQNPNLDFSPEAINFLSNYYADDVRKIKGSISRLSFWMLQNPDQTIISIDTVTELFKGVPTSKFGILNVKKIKEVVSEKYGVSVNAIDGRGRAKAIVEARHIAMYLTKIILNHTLVQIGEEFGGRDHTTVINAERKINKMLKDNKEFKKIMENLKAKILAK